jgi:hypothetical protein
MSRSGYTDDYDDQWGLICWRGAVKSAIRGRRGQAFLREMLAALDAIPTKSLITRELETLEGVCALGAVARQRGLDVGEIDPEDRDAVAGVLGIPRALACEIMHENDEGSGYWRTLTPEQRWDQMRRWVQEQIK